MTLKISYIVTNVIAMSVINTIKHKWTNLCLWIWVKWMIHTEDIRQKAEEFTYKMDSKLKSRK